MMRVVVLGSIATFLLLSTISLTGAFAQSINTCGINFVSGNSVTYGSLQSGATSSEQTITLSNPGTVAGILSVNGTSWKDGTQATIINAANTKFSNSSGTYSAKTPLSATLQNIGTLQPSVNTNTYWQLQANLLSTSFVGDLAQIMNFRVSCDSDSGGSLTDPTFADDFTSYATQSAADTAWASSNTGNFQVNTANDNLDIKTTAGVAAIYHDLGAESVSDTAWVLRNKLTLTTAGSTSLGLFWIMLSDNTSNAQTSHSGLGYYLYDNDNNVYVTADSTNRPDQSTNTLVLSPTISPSTTTYYVEMARLSATSFKVTFYSDSTYTTSLGTKTITVSSGITDLRYIKLMSYTTGAMIGTFDDVKFWNNMTQVPSSGPTTVIYPDGLGSIANSTASSGITASQIGKFGNAWDFSGTGSYVDMGGIRFNLHTKTNWAVSFWMKADSTGANKIIYDDFNVSSLSNIGTAIRTDGTNLEVFNSKGGGTFVTSISIANAILDTNNFHHYVVTYDDSLSSTQLKVYRDGQQIGSANKQNTLSSSASTFTPRLGWAASGNDNPFDGKLDDMAFFTRTLSDSEISALYNGGSGMTVSSLSNLSGVFAYYNFEQTGTTLTNQAVPPAIFSVTGSTSGNNWTFNLSGLNGQIYGGTLDGSTLSSADISSIQSSVGSTWTKATPNTFTVTSGGNAQVLVVAGGGAGGSPYGGGGGAGGLLYSSSKSISAGEYPVTIGSGGKRIQAGSTVPFGYDYWSSGTGENGGNSAFIDMTAIGGGGGRTYYSSPAGGGSGGGGSVYSNSGGSGTSGQGNSGAAGTADGGYSWAKGGGGGGAGGSPTNGGMCANGGTSNSCNGGAGLQYSISGIAQYYAGGGGGWWIGGLGGSGGSGVGGQGGNGLGEASYYCDGAWNNLSLLGLRTEPDYRGRDAVQNTGSGGGGGACVDRTSLGTHANSNDGVGITGRGANGIVIVSYPTGSMSATGGTVTTSGGNTIHTFTYTNPTPTLSLTYATP